MNFGIRDFVFFSAVAVGAVVLSVPATNGTMSYYFLKFLFILSAVVAFSSLVSIWKKG